ncbi:cytochrome bc complex cytochrome b subunit [bacterium]|nr:cytochrome bc complex cytochrome b subunit [bacterium]
MSGFWRSRMPVNEEAIKEFGSEAVPGHLKRWWFALGGTPAYLFIVQVFTGILLTFYYIPNPEKAYDSVRYITETVPFGWYIRGMHLWGSHLLIVAVILHMMRAFFTGTYRKPRELTWVLGVLLLLLMMGMGFTGYSLVYEQLSYWGATVASNLTESAPGIGPILANFIRGGAEIGENTLTRFYIFHIAAVPTLLVMVLAGHIWMVRTHGVKELHFEDEEESEKGTFPFFPNHFLTELLVGLVLMVLLSTLSVVFPATLADPANPLVTPEHIKPEWYFLFTFRWLKLAGTDMAIATMGLFALLFVGWPWVDKLLRKKNPSSEASVLIGSLVTLGLVGMTMWEIFSG